MLDLLYHKLKPLIMTVTDGSVFQKILKIVI